MKIIKKNVQACQAGFDGKSAVRGDGLVVSVEMSRKKAFLTACCPQISRLVTETF